MTLKIQNKDIEDIILYSTPRFEWVFFKECNGCPALYITGLGFYNAMDAPVSCVHVTQTESRHSNPSWLGCWMLETPLLGLIGSLRKLPHPKMLPIGTAGEVKAYSAFLALKQRASSGSELHRNASRPRFPSHFPRELLPVNLCFTLLLKDLSWVTSGKQAPLAPERKMAKGGSGTCPHGY